METRASYVVVGGFVFALFAGVMGFVIWLGKLEIDRRFDSYRIDFSGSVTGLSVGSPVRYRGIPVGQVTDISIDPDNLERIHVFIEVQSDLPIKEDGYAVLESQGLTGVGFIQLDGGTRQAAVLVAKPGDDVPVIASRASVVEEVFESAPEIANQLVVLINRASGFLKPENQRSFESILSSLEVISGAIAAREAEIHSMITNVNAASEDLRSLAEVAERSAESITADIEALADESGETLATLRGTVAGLDAEVTRLSADLADTLVRIDGFAAEAQAIVAENRAPLRDFSETGLYELTQFLIEGRILLEGLNRVTQQLERDPAQILFGSRDRGVETQQ